MHLLFVGSFDPFTNGHMDIALRAGNLANTLLISVINSHPEKEHMFSLDERLEMLEGVSFLLEKQGVNVRVDHFAGLLSSYANKMKVNAIVRGLRDSTDYQNEARMATANRRMVSHIETIFLPSSGLESLVSSTLVRQVYEMGGDYASFVPDCVASLMERKNVSSL